MHRAMLLAGLTLIAAPALAQQARTPPVAAADRDLVVINHGTRPITAIRASSTSSEGWGANRLQAPPIPPGRSTRIRLGRSPDCSWDIQATYADGHTEETRGHDLCHTRDVAFEDAAQTHEAVIINHAPKAIDGIFISPSDADGWGEDRLTNNIPPGGRAVVPWHGACPADLRVVFGGIGAEERHGLDLCTLAIVTIAPGWTTADTPTSRLEAADKPATPTPQLRNDGTAPIVALHADPEGSPKGPDRLADSVLAAGQTIDLPSPTGGSCTYRITATFRDGREASTTADLCGGGGVALK
jgi:hypothetical protein